MTERQRCYLLLAIAFSMPSADTSSTLLAILLGTGGSVEDGPVLPSRSREDERLERILHPIL
ncbi:MAG: hypothetical protein QOC82_2757 [Frankiaceae bacterium]|jgi:hypothetical protein|nr:hypothetical protein [Frankiaceae bacterium]